MNLEANKEALLEAIKAERAYQDEKWGTVHERSFKSLAGWYLIAREELVEAQDAWNSHLGNKYALAELLQFVASCYAYFEQSGEELDRSLLQWHLDEGAPSLEDRLVEIEVRIDGVKREMPNKKSGGSQYCFMDACAMAMATILEYGIVTRETLKEHQP